MNGTRMEDLALAGSEVNPLKSDPDLVKLLKKLDNVKKYKSFQRWKTKFLDRLEQFLYEEGMKPAENACNDFDARLNKFVKMANKVQGFVEKGELSDERKTVKATLALNEMCTNLTKVVTVVEALIPSRSRDEKKRGFTKFHLGAALIRQGFHQYITLRAIEDALMDIGNELQHVADKQQHDLFDSYSTQVQRFCDVMADLNLYEVMMKCLQFQEAPEEEESSSEEPITYTITIETHDDKTLTLELDPTETIGEIKAAIAGDCHLEPIRQVLKFNGDTLDDNDQTLEGLGIQDGDKLSVEPFKVPITVNTMDGKEITAMVDPTDYLSDIKVQLQDESGLPAKNQRLFFNGEELGDNNKTAADYGIKAGSVLDLEPKFIKITVQAPDGKAHKLEVKSSDTVDSIKEKIAEETGMAVPRQVLKMQDTALDNGNTVKELGIQDGSELTVEVYKVPITVNTMDGKQIKLMVEPTDYTSDIKVQLQDESGLPAKNQRLFFNGEELGDNSKTAADYGIKAGSVLDLEPKFINITVQAPDGEAHTLEVKSSDTVNSIKEKIADETGMAVPRQVLKMQDTALDNGNTVKELGIQDGSELTVEVYKVPITVNTMDGKQINLMVEPTAYLSDIKVQLQGESGLPTKNQKLFKNGEELGDNNKTAADYGIKAGSVLDLEPKFIKITVQAPDGKAHTLEVKSSDMVDSIKEKIADETGMAVPRQVLKMQDTALDNGNTVKELGIQDGSELTVEVYKVPITVNTMDGKQINLMVDPTAYLSDIKVQVQGESGLPAKNQKLFKNGEELADPNKTAADYGIKAGSVLNLEPISIKIKVQAPDGKAHTLEVKSSNTVNSIKEKIADETGMAVPRQVLKMQDTALDNGKTVKELGIPDGSELTVEIYKVPITVNTMDGKQIKLMVEPTAYLSDIKVQLQGETGLPAKNQKLFKNGEELSDNNKTAADYGIKAGSVLNLEPISIKITVETPDGKVHTIEVKLSDTIEAIKGKIADETGMAVPRQVLKFQDKELPLEKTVKEMGIHDGSTLTVGIYKVPIEVKAMDGKTISLNAEPVDNIDTIKKMIQKETGLEPKRQYLIFGGAELSKGRRTLEDCGIGAGSTLILDLHKDPIIFVDVKYGTLFAMERELVIEKGALTPYQSNELDFTEATKDMRAREKILQAMKDSPNLGFATQVVVSKEDVEDYEMAEASKVKNMWGVNLKKRERNKKGEEFIFVDPKTGATGELTRKTYIDMEFITPAKDDKGNETLEESEKDNMVYDQFILDLRKVFGVKIAT